MGTLIAVFSWLVFGLIVGALARFLVPGRQEMGWLMTIGLGVVGSFVGGGISWILFGTADGSIHPSGFLMSLVGAIVVVFLYVRLKSAQA